MQILGECRAGQAQVAELQLRLQQAEAERQALLSAAAAETASLRAELAHSAASAAVSAIASSAFEALSRRWMESEMQRRIAEAVAVAEQKPRVLQISEDAMVATTRAAAIASAAA